MKYILSENRQTVHIARNWQQRFWQQELEEHELVYKCPAAEPGYVNVGNGFEIIPITLTDTPEHDPVFEFLVGPSYTYETLS